MSKKALPIEVTGTPRQPLGMSANEFLHNYWQKRPLLIRNAFADFEAPITPDELAGLAMEPAALSRVVQHNRKKDQWTVQSGPFGEDSFHKLGKKDWTLLVQDVDKWDADVAALLDHFQFLPSWRIDDIMISFAAPGGSVGPHVDQYDVFLLQAYGQRQWQINSDPKADDSYREDAELKILKKFTPDYDWVLNPGDMLYLPPGVGHHGEAVNRCMTFSIGMRAPSKAELLDDFSMGLTAKMDESDRYRDSILSVQKSPSEIDAAALTQVRELIRTMATQSDRQINEWFGNFITRYRSAGDISAPPKQIKFLQALNQLDGGAKLIRHPFARFAWCKNGRSALLFTHGEMIGLSASSAQKICDFKEIDQMRWSGMAQDARDAIANLYAQGFYQVYKSRRSQK